MDSPRFKREGWLYTLAFLLALGLRLSQLGAFPLTDAEAGPALQALRLSQGLKPALAPHPFYILSTSVLFFIYGGGTNFLARFLPALAGSALVFLPLLFRERLKPRPGVILAFCLALDPGLVSLSRTAASDIFAVAFLLFAWGFWVKDYSRLAGAFAALALLGGASIWAGLLAFGITWAISQGLEPRSRKNERQTAEDSEPSASNSQPSNQPTAQPANHQTARLPNYRPFLLSFIATFLIAGTLFFIVPNGLSAALASLPAYLRGWTVPSGIASGRLFFSLLVYQPLAVILGLASVVRGWRKGDRDLIYLNLLALVALLLAAFYPSRQFGGLVWALIPLWTLAALELARYFDIFPEERGEIIGVILLTAFILVFAWFDLGALVWVSAPSPEFTLRVWLLFGAIVLLAVSILLVAFGWSVRTAQLGGFWGVILVLGVFSLVGTFGAAGLRGAAFPELWWPPARPAQADLLADTVDDLSEWSEGNDNALAVTILHLDSPALEWLFRARRVSVTDALDPATAPPIVITPYEVDPSLASAYRGQDFIWRQTPSFDTAEFRSWLRWLVTREMPQNGETIILWARDDLFLDASLQTDP
jgi:hypothetical protein